MWTTHAGSSATKSNSESTTAFGALNSPSSRTRSAASQHQHTISTLEAENYADFFEPAVDGPPSPAVIRAFNDKVKQASVSDQHVSQQTTSSSGDLSVVSYASSDRRSSLEQALESFSLSRKSSIKSTTSSMPSKDRPESVQAIGKAIFNRKSKLRRGSLTGSSSSSPDLNAAMAADRSRAASSVSKDHILASMSIFSRRKTVHTGEDATKKKPLISSPYNFQHVAQIHREQVPHLERADPSLLPLGLSGLLTPPALDEDLRVPNFASGRIRSRDEEESVPPHVILRSRENSVSRPTSIHKSHPKQWVKQARSQDQMRANPPPRPPRSPTPLNMGYFDFVPLSMPSLPSRNPSRPSIPRRDSEALGNIMMPGRQQSTAGPRFFSPFQTQGDASSPPPTSSGAPSPFTQERRFSRIIAPTEAPNWPLSAPLHNSSVSTFEAALPEVPEEEEQCGVPSRSHLRVGSAHSSLKGSISVPALRKSSFANASFASHDRTFSRDSVVLGALDVSVCRQMAEADMLDRAQTIDPLRRDSWEAVIDYCYDHEMEADCDYDWHRPSLDLDHEPTVMVTESGDDGTIMSRPPSDCIELPILSPSHHLSPQSSQEVITPSLPPGTKSPRGANFSLPRRERPQRLQPARNESQLSFTEAHGFSLSPSFLIPTEYHHELLAVHTQKLQDADSIAQGLTLDESALATGGSELFVAARASGSTTGSNSNLSSRSVFERHISTTSTNTDYLTMSVSSVDLEGFNFKDDPPVIFSGEPEPDFPLVSPTHSRSRSAAVLLGAVKSQGLSRDTHCSDTNLAGMRSPTKAGGRARSKTLSSTPAGNLSLFPTVAKAPPRS